MKGFGGERKKDSKKGNVKKNSVKSIAKQEIISHAFRYHSEGNISKAIEYYQLFIDNGFKDPRVLSNYGTIYKQTGKIEKAIELYKESISLFPKSYKAYSNLGNLLREIGQLNQAEILLRKAIDLKSDFADSNANLAMVLDELGKVKEAFKYYSIAIRDSPDRTSYHYSISLFLRDTCLSEIDKQQLKDILLILLKREDIPHNYLFKAFKLLYHESLLIVSDKFKVDSLDDKVIEIIINDQLFVEGLKKIVFRDAIFELVLQRIRKGFCFLISSKKRVISSLELQFIIALSEQCFMNEYVYYMDESENNCIKSIIETSNEESLSEIHLAILACYIPLHRLSLSIPSIKLFCSSDSNLKALLKLQLEDTLEEIKLSYKLNKIGSVTDNISIKVKSQYEENPYPRWRYGNYSKDLKISFIQAINDEIRPNSINAGFESHKLKILIAGCGTGKQILDAQRYRNAHITAIDLSSSSLSYAKRKLNELKISNVELIQMDILDVRLLDVHFDIIECCGVLHHMSNPLKGLEALIDTLKPNGFLKIGLYSELARQDIVKAREYISSKYLNTGFQEIRDFRKQVLFDKESAFLPLLGLSDFYTMSECRDLCFHIQEHRFTIEKIKKILQISNLNFLGFLQSSSIKSLYQEYFPEDKKQLNLDYWASFESKQPGLFASMYQFWVSKDY